MSSTNEPPHRHLKQAPAPRRKSKPKFDTTIDAETQEAPVAWVYRPEEASASDSRNLTNRSLDPDQESSSAGLFVVAGMSLFVMTVGTIGLMSLGAATLFSAPFNMARRMVIPG